MLDDGAEPGGLDRKRIVALIARGGSPIAGGGVIVLVIGQPLAWPQIALGGAALGAVDRRDPGEDRTACVETDILDEEIAQRRLARHDDAVLRGKRDGAARPQKGRRDGEANHQASQKWISYSNCQRSVCRGAAGVKPKRK